MYEDINKNLNDRLNYINSLKILTNIITEILHILSILDSYAYTL